MTAPDDKIRIPLNESQDENSRWEYPGFVVYFEREHVIHSVVVNSEKPNDAA